MRFIRLESYIIPIFGNRRAEPYGRMVVEHVGKTRTVRFGAVDDQGRQYITFGRRRYYFQNRGSLYSPKFVFDEPAVSRQERFKVAHLEGLLNNLVDTMVDAAGQNQPVIQKLLEQGFTEDDLVLTLGFPKDEVQQVLKTTKYE